MLQSLLWCQPVEGAYLVLPDIADLLPKNKGALIASGGKGLTSHCCAHKHLIALSLSALRETSFCPQCFCKPVWLDQAGSSSRGLLYVSDGSRGHRHGRGRRSQDYYDDLEPEELTRVFVALFDYDPMSMSPNPDAADEELPFKEGQIIKVGGFLDGGRVGSFTLSRAGACKAKAGRSPAEGETGNRKPT